MKKVKIMLSALVVLAVVGGALAFKAKQQFAFYTLDSQQTTCDNLVQLRYTTVLDGSPTTDIPYTTQPISKSTDPNFPCYSTTVVTTN